MGASLSNDVDNHLGEDSTIAPARLHEAATRGNARVFRDVLETLSSPQRISLCRGLLVDGVSLLQAAAASGNFQIVDMLLQHGAELDRMNRNGAGSALHEAVSAVCSSGNTCAIDDGHYAATIARLLDAGADPFLENIVGQTAVQLASKQSRSLASVVTGNSSRCVDVLRSLERRACVTGALRLHIHPFTSRDFYPVWVVLTPRRYSQPFGAAPKSRSHELWCYGSNRDLKPIFKCLLDGCLIAREDGGLRLLVLPSRQRPPQRCFMQMCDSGERWALDFRPGQQGDPESYVVFNQFVAACVQCSAATSRYAALASASIAAGGGPLQMRSAATLPSGAATHSYGVTRDSPGSMYGTSMPRVLSLPLPPPSSSQPVSARRRTHHHRRTASPERGAPSPAAASPSQHSVPEDSTQSSPLSFPEGGPLESPPGRGGCLAAQHSGQERAGVSPGPAGEGGYGATPSGGIGRGSLHEAAGTSARDEGAGGSLGAGASVFYGANPFCGQRAEEEGAASDGGASDDGTASTRSFSSCCIICMDAQSTVGFRHGFTVHKCVCYACAQVVVARADGDVHCPLCRALVQDVLLVY